MHSFSRCFLPFISWVGTNKTKTTAITTSATGRHWARSNGWTSKMSWKRQWWNLSIPSRIWRRNTMVTRTFRSRICWSNISTPSSRSMRNGLLSCWMHRSTYATTRGRLCSRSFCRWSSMTPLTSCANTFSLFCKRIVKLRITSSKHRWWFCVETIQGYYGTHGQISLSSSNAGNSIQTAKLLWWSSTNQNTQILWTLSKNRLRCFSKKKVN